MQLISPQLILPPSRISSPLRLKQAKEVIEAQKTAAAGAKDEQEDCVDGLITDATWSPFAKTILPYMYMENPDRKIKWNVYS